MISERLTTGARLAAGLACAVEELTAQIRSAEVAMGSYIDPSDTVIESLDGCMRALEERLPQLVLMTGQLTGEDRAACESALQALAALIESTKWLRRALIGHDLAAESLPRPH